LSERRFPNRSLSLMRSSVEVCGWMDFEFRYLVAGGVRRIL
jgi:hypothetical protein